MQIHKHQKMKYLNIFFLFVIFNLKVLAQPVYPLIPFPEEVTIGDKLFRISPQTNILAEPKLEQELKYLKSYILENHLFVVNTSAKINNRIVLRLKTDSNSNPEAYQITSNPREIIIEASHPSGIFYGIQTLIQLFPTGKFGSIKIPCVQINDKPNYTWRGMHLDCSRHFFPISFIKKYIDMLAYYKMNSFHWHLTDDQGWRIEIKKYPKLTEIGSVRKGTMIGHYRDQKYDSIAYGGFYTQKEIKEVIEYAQKRHVNIVPEIEMPGHAVAALAAYPEYSCSQKPCEVSIKWGVETNVFCPSEETFAFLEDVLNEIMDLFPGKYIHIGGDEVPKEEWNNSAFCQQLMKEQKLKNAEELQSYFIRRVEKIIQKKGKTMIGWDEILEGGLAPNAVVMSWRGTEGGIAAAKMNHYVIMTPGSHCYFDHYQGKPESEPLAIGGYTPLEKVYQFKVCPDTLNETESKFILGAQGNVWTEYIKTSEQVEYMAMPRMAALAEVLWSQSSKRDYANFLARLKSQEPYLKNKKINYSKTSL
ncbi:MAG: beta-N-acetylhexosaminidase [Bacteroidia bacterium]|nr:beta-N-acetylhexosaminidase [Bacteroidia bacterium]